MRQSYLQSILMHQLGRNGLGVPIDPQAATMAGSGDDNMHRHGLGEKEKGAVISRRSYLSFQKSYHFGLMFLKDEVNIGIERLTSLSPHITT